MKSPARNRASFLPRILAYAPRNMFIPVQNVPLMSSKLIHAKVGIDICVDIDSPTTFEISRGVGIDFPKVDIDKCIDINIPTAVEIDNCFDIGKVRDFGNPTTIKSGRDVMDIPTVDIDKCIDIDVPRVYNVMAGPSLEYSRQL